MSLHVTRIPTLTVVRLFSRRRYRIADDVGNATSIVVSGTAGVNLLSDVLGGMEIALPFQHGRASSGGGQRRLQPAGRGNKISDKITASLRVSSTPTEVLTDVGIGVETLLAHLPAGLRVRSKRLAFSVAMAGMGGDNASSAARAVGRVDMPPWRVDGQATASANYSNVTAAVAIRGALQARAVRDLLQTVLPSSYFPDVPQTWGVPLQLEFVNGTVGAGPCVGLPPLPVRAAAGAGAAAGGAADTPEAHQAVANIPGHDARAGWLQGRLRMAVGDVRALYALLTGRDHQRGGGGGAGRRLGAAGSAASGGAAAAPLQCAADHGTSTACCGQKGGAVTLAKQCPEGSPTCVGYIRGQHYGHCTAAPSRGVSLTLQRVDLKHISSEGSIIDVACLASLDVDSCSPSVADTNNGNASHAPHNGTTWNVLSMTAGVNASISLDFPVDLKLQVQPLTQHQRWSTLTALKLLSYRSRP